MAHHERRSIIGGFFLFLSVASTTLVPLLFGSNTNDMGSLTAMVLCEVASWCAVPMYAWLLVRGYEHTHSRVIYGMELFVLALVCEVPYDMATSGRAFDLGSQNPVFGLFIALAVLALMDWIAERYQGAMRWILSVVMVLINCWSESSRDAMTICVSWFSKMPSSCRSGQIRDSMMMPTRQGHPEW